MTATIYLTRRLPPGAMAALADSGHGLVGDPTDEPPDRDAVLRDVAGVDAVVCTLTERIDAAVLDAAGSALKVVANCAVGYDNVDVAAAAARGVVVTNTPGVLDAATADLTFALLLASARRVAEADRFVRSGADWIWSPEGYVGLDVSAGATLGLVGLGRIGRAVARRAAAFDLRVLAATRSGRADVPGVESVDLPTLLARSDIVSLHCPLTPDTRGLIDAAALRAMKPGAHLINTARGPIVDEDALADALRSGHLGGAALDVHQHEPRTHAGLRALPNVVLTPHIGSAGLATRERMGRLTVDNALAVLAGRAALTPVSS